MYYLVSESAITKRHPPFLLHKEALPVMAIRNTQADAVLRFWFDETTPKQWFVKDAEFDRTIVKRFRPLVEEAVTGGLDGWQANPETNLALILLLDQMPRNIWRGTKESFMGDAKALALCQKGCDRGDAEVLLAEGKRLVDAAKKLKPKPKADDDEAVFSPEQTRVTFLLMPMMHSEDLAVQEASLPLFKQYTSQNTYDYAVRHRDIIARFGRFPHRNALLGRESTPEEVQFLTEPNSSF